MQFERPGFDPCIREIPWRRKWEPTAVFLPRKFHGQRSLTGYSPCSSKVFSSIQSLSRVQLFATPWIAAQQASLSITKSRSLLKLMSTKSVMPSNHLILCCPLLLLPSIFPSIRVFSNELVLNIRGPKYWNFSLGISPFNEYSGLIFFRVDWFYFLAIQGTFKSLLQHRN